MRAHARNSITSLTISIDNHLLEPTDEFSIVISWMQLRPAGKYLLFEQQRHLIGSSTKLKPFQPALSSASCPAHEALSISFSWGYRCTECVLNAILNLNPSCKYCKDLAATLNVGAYHYMGAAEELARMGGNCIALRAAAVALIILLKAVDPVLLKRYLK